MKIVVIGGSGLIGQKLVANLRKLGHDVQSASSRNGVNTLTGEGLATAMAGAAVVVDVTNSPSFEDEAVMSFFTTSTRNLLSAAGKAGVKHYLALSVVGTERLLASGYFRAKLAQETLVREAGLPYSIIRAGQFFEFLGAIAQASTVGTTVRLPSALMQPLSADDVAAALADYTVAPPANGLLDLAGPEAMGIDEAIRLLFAATHDPRQVVTDVEAPYYGIKPDHRALIPAGAARLAPTGLNYWLRSHAGTAKAH